MYRFEAIRSVLDSITTGAYVKGLNDASREERREKNAEGKREKDRRVVTNRRSVASRQLNPRCMYAARGTC